MNTKHTPAPWQSVLGLIEKEINVKDSKPIRGKTIASVKYFGHTEEEHIANCKVIAAAPELLEEEIKNLEFLKWIAGKARDFNMWSDKVQELHERISKTELAIKKATE